MDKAGKSYWDSRWGSTCLPAAINPYRSGPNYYLDRKFHDFFCKVFSEMKTQNTKLLEIGCARSAWLPYFAKEFGFKVYGVDYSELGCEQALQILSNEGMEGEIVCSDFFSPPESMIGQFDVVVSFGVLEHFQDAQGCILAFSKYLKRNGIMITNIPTLLEAHQKSGLELVSCNYFLSANFGVVNFENQRGNVIYEWILQSFCWLNRVIWFFENLIPVNPSRWCSPYINCVAMKS